MNLPTLILAAFAALTIATPSPQELGIQPHSSVPPAVHLSDLKAAGSGCPPNTLDLSLHGSQVSLSFADFFATAGTSKPSDKRRFCQVSFKVKYSPGWTLSIATSEVKGFIGISSGPTAKYTLQGPNLSHEFNHISSVSANVWSPCGEEVIINIKTDIRLIGKGNGVIGVESQSNKFLNSVNLDWKEC
ncbi:hypothetical protein E2P81_ATG08307 [Venturia nashicola]|uniref:Secreted protein n=1 Tax=Venturia nashicola TaxID=86259 RepID=A0A4Z1P3M3_9PEZI|nr:hypothetical protein E6O75_ATG08491 [Venturia nashicola]TLD21719.1 hypothetical protein E2P81_ATG08307 [Venturia nashicola]